MVDPASAQSARENLLYIRKTLEVAGQLTAVPGKHLMAIGCIAIAGSFVNGLVTGPPWSPGLNPFFALVTWGVVLGLSLIIVCFGIYGKSRQIGVPIQPPMLRKLLWSLCPGLFVGALLTSLAARTNNLDWLPVIWLGSYGAAVTNGGQVSVLPVRYMGVCFLIAAGCAALSPREAGLAWLAIGFGLLHIIFGAIIARRHNG